ISADGLDTVSTGQDTLVLLHVLFRHGNRTPEKGSQFPKDPHLNETFEPFGYGQLTTKGKKTEYEIGEYLRLTYGKFIPEQYSPDVVYALSTNFKRTKMSLQLVLASLFPPLLTDLFSVNLNWQPVPFNIEPGAGLIGLPFIYCVNYLNQYYEYVESEEAQEIIASYRELYQQLSLDTGLKVTSPKQVAGIYSTLESEESYGLKLPEWASKIFPKILGEAASVYFEFTAGNSVLKKYIAGFLLKQILEDSLSRRNGTLKNTKVFLYSAHDFNVAAVLRTLNVFDRHVPPYGATIFFEIHKVGEIYGLKLYYQDYTKLSPQLLTIPGCSSFCELDRFHQLVEEYLPGANDH
ncbi:His Phos 2 domain containing protein, partial [Asbolus verrucosus]